MAGLLESDGMITNLAQACSDPKDAFRVVNRAILSTLSGWPESLATDPEALILMDDGSTDIDGLDINWPAFLMDRSEAYKPNSLMAHDVAIFESSDAEQQDVTMLFITSERGMPLGCWPIEGDTAAFLQSYRALEQRCREADYELELITARRFSDAELLGLFRDRIRFLAVVEADDQIQKFIASHRPLFTEAKNYMEARNVFGVKTQLTLHAGGVSAALPAFVFRDPESELGPSPVENCAPGFFALAGNQNLPAEAVLNRQATLSNAQG